MNRPHSVTIQIRKGEPRARRRVAARLRVADRAREPEVRDLERHALAAPTGLGLEPGCTSMQFSPFNMRLAKASRFLSSSRPDYGSNRRRVITIGYATWQRQFSMTTEKRRALMQTARSLASGRGARCWPCRAGMPARRRARGRLPCVPPSPAPPAGLWPSIPPAGGVADTRLH